MNLWFIPVAFVLIGVSGVASSMLRTRLLHIEKKVSELESTVKCIDIGHVNLLEKFHRENAINDSCHGVLSMEIDEVRKAIEELKPTPKAEVLKKTRKGGNE